MQNTTFLTLACQSVSIPSDSGYTSYISGSALFFTLIAIQQQKPFT